MCDRTGTAGWHLREQLLLPPQDCCQSRVWAQSCQIVWFLIRNGSLSLPVLNWEVNTWAKVFIDYLAGQRNVCVCEFAFRPSICHFYLFDTKSKPFHNWTNQPALPSLAPGYFHWIILHSRSPSPILVFQWDSSLPSSPLTSLLSCYNLTFLHRCGGMMFRN